MKKCIGIDLGGTKIMAGVIDADGQVIEQLEAKTPNQGDDVLATITALCQRLKTQYCVDAVGLGTPGQIAFPEGIVLGCTPNLKNWEKRNLRQHIEGKVQLPVVVDNDANAATFAEFKAGAGRGFDDFVLLTLGTGLGSGRVSGGHLYRGYHNLGIGYGHMIIEARGRYCNCGQQGCLESYVSGTGIVKTYRLKGGDLTVTSPEIFSRAIAGELRAQETLDFTWEMLAVAVVNIFNTLSPQVVLLGGGISRQGENVILAPLRAKVTGIMGMPFETPESIRLASLRSQAGMIGAGLMAFDLF